MKEYTKTNLAQIAVCFEDASEQLEQAEASNRSLQEQVEHWKSEKERCHAAHVSEIAAQIEANRSLREALHKYGDHLPGCNREMCWHAEHEPNCCDCGWQALAAQPSAPKGTK